MKWKLIESVHSLLVALSRVLGIMEIFLVHVTSRFFGMWARHEPNAIKLRHIVEMARKKSVNAGKSNCQLSK